MLLSLQVSEAGVHRPHVGGIHGRSNDGSYSLVLAGGFEDEVVGCLYFVCVDASLLISLFFMTWSLGFLWSAVGPGRWVHLHRQRGSWPLRKQANRRALFWPDPDPHEQVWHFKKFVEAHSSPVVSVIWVKLRCFNASCEMKIITSHIRKSNEPHLI